VARLDCRDVAALLAPHCETLFTQFVPDARLEAGELRGHGPDGSKWTMAVRGSKRGVWCNWGQPDQRGDCLELIHAALFGGQRGRGAALKWALNWLGLSSAAVQADQAWGEHIAAAKEYAARRRVWQEDAEARERERRRRQAFAIYLHKDNVEGIHSPELQDYLRTRRVPIELLDEFPTALRFTRQAYYDRERPALPAMLAPIIHPVTRRHMATHITYLEYRDHHWRNLSAPGALRRKTLGDKKGGIIPLLRGASRKRLRDAPDGDVLLISEGIENGISAAVLIRDWRNLPDDPRVFAAVDAQNWAALELPPVFSSVILAHDRDDQRLGKFRLHVGEAWLEEGRSVQHFRPPPEYKDFNEYAARLMQERTAAA
jgi:hypothetical protein